MSIRLFTNIINSKMEISDFKMLTNSRYLFTVSSG